MRKRKLSYLQTSETSDILAERSRLIRRGKSKSRPPPAYSKMTSALFVSCFGGSDLWLRRRWRQTDGDVGIRLKASWSVLLYQLSDAPPDSIHITGSSSAQISSFVKSILREQIALTISPSLGLKNPPLVNNTLFKNYFVFFTMYTVRKNPVFRR